MNKNHLEKPIVIPAQKEWTTNRHNAQMYEAYVERYKYYPALSRRRIALADIKPDMFIVDLACGTGITTHQARNKMHQSGRIIGVDLAPPMLDIARSTYESENIQFLNIPGEEIAEFIDGGIVDRVLCNSAFWKMDGKRTMGAVQRILKPKGLFAFNIVGNYSQVYPNGVIPQSFPDLMREVADETGIPFPMQRKYQVFAEANSIERLAKKSSFVVVRKEAFIYQRTADEVIDLAAIPATQELYFPNLDQLTRDFIHTKAEKRLDPDASYPEAWTYYLLQKR